MAFTEENLREIEEETDIQKNGSRVWILRPEPIPKVSRKEFVAILSKARTTMRHAEWSEAVSAAKELAEVGGVLRVFIVSVRRKASYALEVTFNTSSTLNNGKKKDAKTK